MKLFTAYKSGTVKSYLYQLLYSVYGSFQRNYFTTVLLIQKCKY